MNTEAAETDRMALPNTYDMGYPSAMMLVERAPAAETVVVGFPPSMIEMEMGHTTRTVAMGFPVVQAPPRQPTTGFGNGPWTRSTDTGNRDRRDDIVAKCICKHKIWFMALATILFVAIPAVFIALGIMNDEPDFSISVDAVFEFDVTATNGAMVTTSPALNLTVQVRNWSYFWPFCSYDGQLNVSYMGEPLGKGDVPELCVRRRSAAEVPAAAWASMELRMMLVEEVQRGEAAVAVDVALRDNWSRTFDISCNVRLGPGLAAPPSPCQYTTEYSQ